MALPRGAICVFFTLIFLEFVFQCCQKVKNDVMLKNSIWVKG